MDLIKDCDTVLKKNAVHIAWTKTFITEDYAVHSFV